MLLGYGRRGFWVLIFRELATAPHIYCLPTPALQGFLQSPRREAENISSRRPHLLLERNIARQNMFSFFQRPFPILHISLERKPPLLNLLDPFFTYLSAKSPYIDPAPIRGTQSDRGTKINEQNRFLLSLRSHQKTSVSKTF